MIQETFILKVNEYSVIRTGKHINATLSCAGIPKWRQNDKLMIVYISPSNFFIIPKRIHSQEVDIHQRQALLEKQVGQAV